MNSTLLELNEARCSVNEFTLLDNVTLCTTSDRVGLSGNTIGIASLMTGEAQLVSGEFKILGRPLSVARSQRLFGCALPPKAVPPSWTIRQILELAAEMAGYTRRESAARVKAVAERIGQTHLLKRPWSRSSKLDQALATLALGLLTDAPLLFVRLPLDELQAQDSEQYFPILCHAAKDVALIAELDRPALLSKEIDWIESLDEIIYVSEAGGSGNLGPLRPYRVRYLVRVLGDRDRLDAELKRAGLPASAINAPSDLQTGCCSFLVNVDCDATGASDTGPVLDLCVESGSVVLELVPIVRV